VTEHSTYCRLCGAICGLVATVEDDRVVRVRGDGEDPISKGYACPKGRALGVLHHHPDRLDAPEVRGEDGARHHASWGECLDDLTAALEAIRDEHGRDSIAIYMATASSHDALGGRTLARFGTLLGTCNRYSAVTIDAAAKPLVSELMAGRSDLFPSLDLERATLTVFIGCNPVVSHGHYNAFPDPVNRLRELVKDGREIWVVDPRRTETVALATRHLQPRPGTDWALLAFAVRSLLDDGGADEEYLVTHTSGRGELRDAVDAVDLDRAVAITGLDPSDVTDFVAAIRRHGRIAAQTGTGVTMSAEANVTEWLTWALQVVTASYDRPGGMWFNPGFLSGHDRRMPPSSAPSEVASSPPSRPDLPSRMGEYPCAALVDEIEAGNVRALIVFGGNPVSSFPQPERVRAAFGQLDVLAVADVLRTETVELATHVLPCAGQLERADVPYFLDQFLPEVSTRYTPAVVEPAEERRPAWRIFGELGRRMGIAAVADDVDLDHVREDELLAPIVDRGRAAFAEVRDSRVVTDERATFGWVERTLPEGRWQLAPAVLAAQLATLLGDAAARASDSGRVVMIPRRQVRHLNSVLRDVGAGPRLDEPDVVMHPHDARVAGVGSGDQVVVSSRHGSAVFTARLDAELRVGVVSVPHGWSGTAGVGYLTSAADDCDPLTGMVRQSGIAVELRPAPGA
jgi:anaerobic selenocysteine-containing dehydrogenase